LLSASTLSGSSSLEGGAAAVSARIAWGQQRSARISGGRLHSRRQGEGRSGRGQAGNTWQLSSSPASVCSDGILSWRLVMECNW
jgi:hypothetical protein